LLRAVNIPVQYVYTEDHAIPFFPTEGLYLSHGDDPYDVYSRIHTSGQATPSTEFFISAETWDVWFGPSVPPATRLNNISRRPVENAVTYLPDYLMFLRCDDISAGRSNAEARVFTESLSKYYELADLQAANLWQRLDAKIQSLGGCTAIRPF
jgi:hypothetical protein